MNNEEHIKGIKRSIDDIIGADTVLKRRKKSEDDIQKEKFEKIIQALESIEVRSMILGNDLNLDFTSYNETFLTVIDDLLLIQFGKEACELIFFYLYERIAPDGGVNELVDEFNNVVTLTSPSELWYLIKKIQENTGKSKKK
jgi:hypothetical protein